MPFSISRKIGEFIFHFLFPLWDWDTWLCHQQGERCLMTYNHKLHPNMMTLDDSTCTNHVKHYNDVIMTTVASQITSLTIVYSAVYSDAEQRKHQSSASLAFVRVNSPHKWPVTRKMFPFDDVIMSPLNERWQCSLIYSEYCHSHTRSWTDVVCGVVIGWRLVRLGWNRHNWWIRLSNIFFIFTMFMMNTEIDIDIVTFRTLLDITISLRFDENVFASL